MNKLTLAQLLTETNCHAEPYPGGGFQVFYTGNADRRFWHLCDAHVAGTLSGPALHLIPAAKPAPMLHRFDMPLPYEDPEADAQLAQIAEEAAAVIAQHEQLNRVHYFPAQRERIAREIPKHGTPERTTSGFELAAYRMPNGSRFVTLCDGSKETGKAYAAEIHAKNPPRF